MAGRAGGDLISRLGPRCVTQYSRIMQRAHLYRSQYLYASVLCSMALAITVLGHIGSSHACVLQDIVRQGVAQTIANSLPKPVFAR